MADVSNDHQDVAPCLRASVIIPTYNRRAMLLQTLASLERQTLPPDSFEVIVAIDGSTDGTLEALTQLRPPYDLRWVWQQNRGLAAARNAAARLGRHEVLIELDDDQLASPDLIAAHLAAHRRHGTVLVQGDYPLAPGPSRSGASLVYERARRNVMSSIAHDGSAAWHVWGGNLSVRRRTWLEVGGYDETFRDYGGEDTELGLRIAALGVPFVFDPRARSYHQHAGSPFSLARHAFSEGRAIVRIARKHALSLDGFSGSAIRGPLDGALTLGWRWLPPAMKGLGQFLAACLFAADLARIPPAQVAIARVVRRYHRVGGITREQRRPSLIQAGSQSASPRDHPGRSGQDAEVEVSPNGPAVAPERARRDS